METPIAKKKALTVRKTAMIALDFISVICNCNCLVSARNVSFKLTPKHVFH